MIEQGKKLVPPPETVTASVARADSWEANLAAVGTLTAVQGVTISADLAGKVASISFEPGAAAKRGDILVRQDTSTEEAQLPGAVAQVNLTRANLDRAEQLLARGIIAKVDRDNAVAASAQAEALANSIRSAISKKTVRAPFSGHLGIRQVNLGQHLGEGDPIVTLQSLDPIYADFTLPEQQLPSLRTGLTARLTADALPGLALKGKVTAVNPLVDPETRNIRVQATVANRDGRLRPGMFVNVAVVLPARQKVLAIPATAVLYAPYSNSVFVVEDDKEGKGKVLRQQFVHLGERRGDFIAVTEGLKEGEAVATTGVFKLRNGQPVVIDNKLAPAFELAPRPDNN